MQPTLEDQYEFKCLLDAYAEIIHAEYELSLSLKKKQKEVETMHKRLIDWQRKFANNDRLLD